MKRHLSIHDMVGLLSGEYDDAKQTRMMNHMRACKSCAVRYRCVQIIMYSTVSGDLAPSAGVRERILDFFDRFNASPNKREKTFIPYNLRKRYAAFVPAVTVAAVFAVLFFLFEYNAFKTKDLHLRVLEHSGSVDINQDRAGLVTLVDAGDTVQVFRDSSALLGFDDIMNIDLADNTAFRIVRAEKIERTDAFQFRFYVEKGRIVSESKHADVNLDYIYETPHCLIYSIGTRFNLNVSERQTEIVVFDGAVRLKSKYNSEELVTQKNIRYTVFSGKSNLSRGGNSSKRTGDHAGMPDTIKKEKIEIQRIMKVTTRDGNIFVGKKIDEGPHELKLLTNFGVVRIKKSKIKIIK